MIELAGSSIDSLVCLGTHAVAPLRHALQQGEAPSKVPAAYNQASLSAGRSRATISFERE